MNAIKKFIGNWGFHNPEIIIPLPGNIDGLSLDDLSRGIVVWGSNGSGKTSTVGTEWPELVLKHRSKPGALLLAVKKDEGDRLTQLVETAGRTESLIIINEQTSYYFNPLEYELYRNGRGNEDYMCALDVIMAMFLSGEEVQEGGSSGAEQERFFDKSMRKCIIRKMMILVLSDQPVTIKNLKKILVDAFNVEEVERYLTLCQMIEGDDEIAAENAYLELQDWASNNFFLYCFEKANTRTDLTPDQLDTMELIGDFFLKIFPRMSEKTRAIIEESCMGLYEPFNSGFLKRFCSEKMSPELRPERCYEEGAIFLIDIPVKEHGISAVYVAMMFKKMFQLAMERRQIRQEKNPRPVLLFIDEYHFLCSAKDQEFQTSCRSSKVITFYITQSINNLRVAMGKNHAEARVKSLLSNLGTQVFFSNFCHDTNTYAANLIGKRMMESHSSTMNSNGHFSESRSNRYQYVIPPEHFSTALRSGGPINKLKVDSIVVSSGRLWSTGEPFVEVTFDQRRKKSFLNFFNF